MSSETELISQSREDPPAPQEQRRSHGGASALSAIGVLATRLAAKPLTILISILSAIWLGPEDKGFAAWIVVITSLAAILFGFGCGAAIRFLISGRKDTLRELAWTSIAIGIVNGLLGAIVVGSLLYFDLLGGLTAKLPDVWKYSMVLMIPLMVMQQILNRALIGESQFRVVNLFELGTNVVYSLLLVILVIVARWGLTGAVAAYYGSQLLLFVGMTAFVFRFYRPLFRFDWEICRRSYSYGLRIWIGGLTNQFNSQVDSLLVGLVTTANVLGNYSVAISIARSLLTIPQAVNLVLANRLAILQKRNAAEETALVHRCMFWLVVALSALAGPLGFMFLPLVMPEFTELPSVLLVLLAGTCFMASFTVLNAYFASQGMPGRTSIAQLAGFVVGAIATPLLVLWIGGVGAAIGSSLAYAVIAGSLWYFFWRQSPGVARGLYWFGRGDWNWFRAQLRAAGSRLALRRKAKKLGAAKETAASRR